MARPDHVVPLNFGRLDLAEPVDAPPVVFFNMRVPCACGRSLSEPVYTFFPSSVFVHGECPECGPQSAIFAPHMRGQMEELPACLTRTLQTIVQQVGRIYQQTPSEVLAELFDSLVKAESLLTAAEKTKTDSAA